MQRLSGVFLEMRAGDADGLRRGVGKLNLDLSAPNDRRSELADLIALREIGIEVVLPVEDAFA